MIAADFSSKKREGEVDIPQFNVRAAMGSGQLPNDYVEIIRHVTMHKAHLDLLGITYTSAANLAIITGWGQSMAGTINHGEPVFVDRGITQFIGDGVYVFTWDDLVYIKRVQKVSKTHFKIISDNRDHDPFEVLIEDVVFHAQALLAWNARKL
ncbi:S24 family peptidase [Halopseudomonas litoralis]|uniref:S24 family peptidase n=1 Tax=Halopseudomonas litoralis TaxID=797277 RepID=UPI001E37C5EC|nr:S24 family peptidase [Halopseudomonas litoralis]